MSGAIDANVLLYACDESHALCEPARALVDDLASKATLYLPWPVISAFLRVSTHARIFDDPLTPDEAMTNVERLLALPGVRPLSETDDFWRCYRTAVDGLHPRGPFVSDAHLAALLLANGIQRLYTNDADFERFEFLDVCNPFR